MEINNKKIKKNIVKELVDKIKAKKELSNTDDFIVIDKLENLFRQKKKYLYFISSADSFDKIKRSKIVDYIIKEIRKELRIKYGVFQGDEIDKIKKYLKELEKDKSILLHKKILSLHLSSKERLSIYPKFYKEIFSITGKPNSIIDIACGLNPFSYPYMRLDKVEYTAIELNSKDAEIIQRYFDIMDIKGKAIGKDITKMSFKGFKADIAFAFKIFDFIPGKEVERIIKELDVKWIIASFSTKTIADKKMKYPKRGWFQRMLKRLNLSYKKIEYDNEIVYVIEK